MQRIVKRKYPVRNPFGDKVQVKFRTTFGSSINMPGAASQFVRVTGSINDLSVAQAAIGGSPGYSLYPELFNRYRVTGLKIKFTPLLNSRATDGTTVPPESLIAFVNGGPLINSPQANSVPEQRWCKYKPINNWQVGGATKSVSLYLSTLKTAGADRTAANDMDYTATTIAASPWYNAPVISIPFEYGICALKGSNLNYKAGEKICDYLVTYTYYVSFWDRRPITI